jgi:RHS repeat-associated protein
MARGFAASQVLGVILTLLTGTTLSRAQALPPYVIVAGTAQACGGADSINQDAWGCTQSLTSTSGTVSYQIEGKSSGTTINQTITATYTNDDRAGTGSVGISVPIYIYVLNTNAYDLSVSGETDAKSDGAQSASGVTFSWTLSAWSTSGNGSVSRPALQPTLHGDSALAKTFFGAKYNQLASIAPTSVVRFGGIGSTDSATTSVTITIQPNWLSAHAGRWIDPSGTDTESILCAGKAKSAFAQVNKNTGGSQVKSTDPIATRGYPLATVLYVNSQSKFSTLVTPIGLGGAFTYGIALRTGSDGVRYIIGEDGSEFSFGSARLRVPPSPEPGVFSQLVATSKGWALINAGPPSSLHRSGNFRYDFAANGKLLRVTDPSGNIQQVTYDPSARNPVQVADLSTGKVVTFEYGSGGLISRVVENGVAARVLTYSNNRLVAIVLTDQNGIAVTRNDIVYDSQGRLSSLSADNNPATSISWNYTNAGGGISLANMTWGSGPTAGSTGLNYFAQPAAGATFRVAKANLKGGITNFDYDSVGNLVGVHSPIPNGATSAPTTTITYYENRTIQSISNGAIRFTYTYNAQGNPAQISNNAGQSWTMLYEQNGIDLKSMRDSVGSLLALDYADAANPHSPTTLTDAANHTWTKSYNAHGQILTVTPPPNSPTGPITFVYDESPASPTFGYLKQVTNGALDTVSVDSYSALGDPTSITTSPRSGITNTTQYQRDAAQRLIKLTRPDGKTVQLTYDGRDLSKIVDENGAITTFDYCPSCGALEAVHAPLSKSMQAPHDGDHDVSQFIDPRNMATNFVYGEGRELKQTQFPDGQSRTQTFDSFNRLKTVADSRGQITTVIYDSAGRVSQLQFSGGPTQTSITYLYYPDNRLQKVTDEAGMTTYTYTPSRLIDSVTYNFTGLPSAQVLKYTYNPDNTVASLAWSNGSSVVATWSYTYDGAGRITKVSDNSGNSSSYSYDREGKVTTQVNSNGTAVGYSYNEARGWPAQITWNRGSTVFSSYGLTYDGGSNSVGNLSNVVESNGSQTTYGYDALYRLMSETRSGTGAYSTTTGYDLANNVITRSGVTFAAYDAANKISGLTGGAVTYDGAGNVLTISGAGVPATTLTWDTRNKLRSQTQGVATTTYKYNGFGQRVVRTLSSGVTTYYVFVGSTLVGEVTGGAPSVAYMWGADGVSCERILVANRTLFYHFGPQGETRQLTDASGSVADTYAYDAYGKLLQSAGADPNPFRYGGKFGYYADGESGLMLAGARWYSPHLMRWLSRDPIGYEGGENQYAYVRANPVRFDDATGLADEAADPTPPLKLLHPETTINSSNQSAVDYWSKQSTESIVESLRPGASQPLVVKPDGTVVEGNTRISILEQRGVDVNILPRTPYESEVIVDPPIEAPGIRGIGCVVNALNVIDIIVNAYRQRECEKDWACQCLSGPSCI